MTWKEMNKKYPMARDKMDFETEIEFVKDCFDAYEQGGFTDTYRDVHGQSPKHDGKPFKVVRRLEYSTSECDLECLPMWEVEFEDGFVMDCYPEEITIDERKEA